MAFEALAERSLINAATWSHHQSKAKNAVGGLMRIKQACACLHWAHHRVQCTFINSTVHFHELSSALRQSLILAAALHARVFPAVGVS